MNLKKIILASISVICLFVVASPVTENWKDDPKDSFPLSHYPMFTNIRGETTVVTYISGVDKNNNYYPIPHKFVIPGSGFNTARTAIRNVVANGHARPLCNFAAKQLRDSTVKPYSETVELAVISSRLNIEEFMNKRFKYPKEYKVHAQCTVKDGY